MARVLVTGGAGYIGSHACKALSRAGHEPIVYDSLEHGFRDFVCWGPLEEGSTLDNERLAGVLRTHRPDAVMHFAAYIAAAGFAMVLLNFVLVSYFLTESHNFGA